MPQEFTVAAVQAAPIPFDLEATVEKACGLISQAAAKGADLVVFPEAFIHARVRLCDLQTLTSEGPCYRTLSSPTNTDSYEGLRYLAIASV